jgi:hypothetical protein
MLELLFTFVQIVCLVGYLYGAYAVCRHVTGLGTERPDGRNRYAPLADASDQTLLRRYLANDL